MYRILGACVKSENMIATGYLVKKSRENPLDYYTAELQGLAPFFSLKPAEMTSHLSPSTPLLYKQHALFL